MTTQQTKRQVGRDVSVGDSVEVAARLSELATGLTSAESTAAADLLRRAASLLRSHSGNVRAEERLAWDSFAASWRAAPGLTSAPYDAAEWADKLLEQRRGRFGGP